MGNSNLDPRYKALTKTENVNGGTLNTYADGTSEFIQRPAGWNQPTTPSSNNPPAPNNNIIRYQAEDPYAAALKNYTDTLAKDTDITTKRSELLKARDEEVNSISNYYAGVIQQENRDGYNRSGQTRAFSARSGILGQDFGVAQAEQTNQYNKQRVRAIETERDYKISVIFDKFYDRMTNAETNAKNAALKSQEVNLNFLKDQKTEAREDVKVLAQSGSSLSDLTNEEKNEMIKQTGWDDFMLEAVYNVNKPKQAQVDYQYKMEGNKLFAYGIDPSTGELKFLEHELDIEVPKDYKPIVTPDGTLFFYNADGEIIQQGKEGQFAKEETEITTANGRRLVIDSKGNIIKDLGRATTGSGSGSSNKIYGAGYSADDINKIKSDLKEHGLATTLLGAGKEQQQVINDVYKEMTNQNKEEEENEYDTDYENLSDDQLNAILEKYTDEDGNFDQTKAPEKLIVEATNRNMFEEEEEEDDDKKWYNPLSWF